MLVFLTYLPVFLLKFWSGELVGCKIWFCIQRVPTLHNFYEPRYPINKKYLNKRDDDNHHICLGISCLWGKGVRKKYAVWVLVGWGIKLCIQWALPIEIWVKTKGDMSKIRTKKVVIFFSSSKINKFYFIILTIILLFSLGGPFWVEISSNWTKPCR